jgi:hypothetical protein
MGVHRIGRFANFLERRLTGPRSRFSRARAPRERCFATTVANAVVSVGDRLVGAVDDACLLVLLIVGVRREARLVTHHEPVAIAIVRERVAAVVREVLSLEAADRVIAVRADDPAGVLLCFLLIPLRVGVRRDQVQRIRLFRNIAYKRKTIFCSKKLS